MESVERFIVNKNIQSRAESLFESIKHVDEQGNEYWLARELAIALDYTWEGFEPVIARAKVSVVQSGLAVENHFRHVSKMVSVGYGNDRDIGDIELNRYACYIVAQNGNAAIKPRIAEAQSYFALQTRKQELSEQRDYDIKRLIARHEYSESEKHITGAVLEKGVSQRGLRIVKAEGDKAMFGGNTTQQMKRKYGITNPKTPLANRAPNVVLAAKSLANEMTAKNLEDFPIEGMDAIKDENSDNNLEVRRALVQRGIVPEVMPPEEDTDKVMRRLMAEDKKQVAEGESLTLPDADQL
jgi:DNA-damage-inducible protein D